MLRLRGPGDESGQSIVELALALPMLAFMLLGGADMARAYAIQLAVQNGARAGAEAAALAYAPTASAAVDYARQEMDRTPGMDATNATVTATFTKSDGTACTGAGSTAVAGTSSLATPCYAVVRVEYEFETLVPWPGLPNTFSFDRTTKMRRYQ